MDDFFAILIGLILMSLVVWVGAWFIWGLVNWLPWPAFF